MFGKKKFGTPRMKLLIRHCQQCLDKVIWPAKMCPEPPLYFNAGMLAYEPSLSTYSNLLAKLKVTHATPFAEQDFFNMYFNYVYKPMSNKYNLVLAMLWRHPENVEEVEKVKVVHYCAAGSKPWRYTGEETNMDRDDIKMCWRLKWRDIYNDESLDYKNMRDDASDADGGFGHQPLLEGALAKAVESVAECFTVPSAAQVLTYFLLVHVTVTCSAGVVKHLPRLFMWEMDLCAFLWLICLLAF
ncbi:hypothetical protein QQ045_033496 [Rhodiola kirilowii]